MHFGLYRKQTFDCHFCYRYYCVLTSLKRDDFMKLLRFESCLSRHSIELVFFFSLKPYVPKNRQTNELAKHNLLIAPNNTVNTRMQILLYKFFIRLFHIFYFLSETQFSYYLSASKSRTNQT